MKQLLPILWAFSALFFGIPSAQASDNFSAATSLTGSTATSTENSQNATVEAGENNQYSRSLWWKWTAPETGVVSVDTVGSSAYSKILDILIPSTNATPAVNSLAWVRQAGGAGYYTPVVNFPVVAGTTYYIRVSSYQTTNYGNVSVSLALNNNTSINQLTFQSKATAANDFFANRAQLTGYSPSAIGYYLSATVEANEPDAGGYRSLWWTWTAPETGILSIDTEGSTSGGGYGDNYIEVFTGSSIASLRFAAAIAKKAKIPVFKGAVYSICISSSMESAPSFQTAAGDIVLALNLNTASAINSLNITSLGTTNDIFANRVSLTGSSVSSIACSVDSSRESNEPANTANATLWWTWTASNSGSVTISTTNSSSANGTSDVPRVLSVWTGGTLAALQPVVSAGTSSTATPSVTFTASAGQTYQIAVGAYSSSGQPNSVVLTLSGPGGPPAITVPSLAIRQAVQLEWMAEKGSTYQLQTSTDNVIWTNSGSAIAGDGVLHQVSQRIDRNHTFFRISRQ